MRSVLLPLVPALFVALTLYSSASSPYKSWTIKTYLLFSLYISYLSDSNNSRVPLYLKVDTKSAFNFELHQISRNYGKVRIIITNLWGDKLVNHCFFKFLPGYFWGRLSINSNFKFSRTSLNSFTFA